MESIPLSIPQPRPLKIYSACQLGFNFSDPLGRSKIVDESGLENNGEIIGATWGERWISFDDIDDRIKVLDDTSLEYDTDESFSISFLMKILNNDAEHDLISKIDTGVTNWQGYHVTLNINGKIQFMLHDTTKPGGVWPLSITSVQAVDDGKWHTINAVRNASTDKAHIYIDTVLDKTGNDISTLSTANAKDLFIGCRNGTGKFYGGFLAQMHICKYVLNQQKINELDSFWRGYL